jgi:hypothetical protein
MKSNEKPYKIKRHARMILAKRWISFGIQNK